MKLTQEHIEKLYAFTKKHYVEYYDLQTELVDHLSNGIEAQWQENKNISFDEALRLEFKKFGIFGFTDLVAERQAKMSKRYNKLILSILKTYFTLPRVISTLLLFLIILLVIQYISCKFYVVLGLVMVPLSMLFYKTMKHRIQHKKRRKRGEKIWMFEEIISSYGQSIFVFQLIIQFPSFLRNPEKMNNLLTTVSGSIIVAAIIVVFLLMMYIMLYVIPSEAKKYIIKAHPEYNLV